MPIRPARVSPVRIATGLLLRPGALAAPVLAFGLAANALAQAAPDPMGDLTDRSGLRETIAPADPGLPPSAPAPAAAEPDEPDQTETPQPPSRTAPNYGKPRPFQDHRLAYPGQRKRAKKPLPRTEPYTTAPPAIRRDYAAPPAPPPPTPYARPAQIPHPPKPKLEENPYAPLGVDIGSLRLFPFVETSIGHDSNANRAPTALAKGSTFTRLDGGFRAISNWSAHEFRADVSGAYSKFYNVEGADRPEGLARFNLRLDATRETKLDFELRGALTTQRPGSPELNAAVTSRPPIFTYGATGGVTRSFGRFETTLAALIDRTTYDDGRLSNGVIVPLSRDDYTAYGLRGRVGYEFTPGVKPFVEATVDTRRRDAPLDINGFERNSTGLAVRAGSTFEITRTLAGEVSGGWLERRYADARLPELRGPTFDAALIWTATPLTTVTLRAATSANETIQANSSGYISRRISAEVSHALLRNLTLGAIAQWQSDRYQGIALNQTVLTGALKAEYALTRSVVVRGSFTHERLKSSVPGADYTANVYLLGLRLQR